MNLENINSELRMYIQAVKKTNSVGIFFNINCEYSSTVASKCNGDI